MKIERIPVGNVVSNTGQIDGLPTNPRAISGEKLDKLKASLQEDPAMMDARPIMVVVRGNEFVAIGGNMRLEACKQLGWQDVPCVILPLNTSVETLQRYAIKDNASFGEWDWDLLTTDWDADLLADWGVDVPQWDEPLPYNGIGFDSNNKKEDSRTSDSKIVILLKNDLKREEIISELSAILGRYSDFIVSVK